jgi:hypothetical protein
LDEVGTDSRRHLAADSMDRGQRYGGMAGGGDITPSLIVLGRALISSLRLGAFRSVLNIIEYTQKHEGFVCAGPELSHPTIEVHEWIPFGAQAYPIFPGSPSRMAAVKLL